MRSSAPIRFVALSVLTGFALFAATSTAVHAQGGMGGMGGGMGGGRRGGMGNGQGMGGGGSRSSPATMVKETLEKNDPIAFFLDRKKSLTLSNPQKDSLKAFRKEMQRMQEPLFKDLDKIFADEKQQGGARGGQVGGRGMGAMLPDTAKTIVARLTDIQDAYRDRARGQLNDGQRHISDSLMTALLDEERKKNEAERAKRRDRG